jgi:hypothetical protein
MYSFRQRQHDNHPAMFVQDSHGNYAPVPAAAALRWLSEAANSGVSFQRLVQENGQPVLGGGARNEAYLPVEGGLFKSPGQTTLLVQNASSANFSFDPSTLFHGQRPNRIEILAMSELANLEPAAAKIETLDTAGPITIPPFSLTRICGARGTGEH